MKFIRKMQPTWPLDLQYVILLDLFSEHKGTSDNNNNNNKKTTKA